MKRRIARKIFNAFYSFKPNYWNGYKGFTIYSFFACKNPRLQHAINIAYKYKERYAPIPTKPKSVFEQAYKCADSFIDRLQIEYDELKERYNKLDNFLESGKAEKVCEENQIWLMALQRINMQNYLGNLATRLKFLKDAPFQTQG